MTGAMYAGISGMRAHMTKLSVIGNNVANVNTVGYKAGFTTFAESLYSTTKSGSNGTNLMGGTNPIQIGYGCSISNVDLDMSTKNYMPTGKNMDCMIAGDGFFMVGDKVSAGTDPQNLTLSRVGDFSFKDGYLVDGRGNIVYGFNSAADAAAGGTAADFVNGTNTAQTKGVSTELGPIRLPYSAAAKGVVKEGTPWYPGVDEATGKFTPPTKESGNVSFVGDEPVQITLTGVGISENGQITGTNANGEPVVVGYVALASVGNPGGVTHMGGAYYKALDGAGTVRVSSIDGVVSGALGNKAAPVAGGTGTSPLATILAGGSTQLNPGGLESSGADVATEFSEMITTQRGYQASTRIITVTDSMLEELVNIKR